MINDIDPTLSMERVAAFVARWRGSSKGEIKTAQQHFVELCTALSVPPPPPDGPIGVYGFEEPVTIPGGGDHPTTTQRMDVYRKGYFVWENKQGTEAGDRRQGHGRRLSDSWSASMNRARGQAISYARHIPGRAPPFIVVCDVGHHFEVWNDFTGVARDYESHPSRRFLIEELQDPRTATSGRWEVRRRQTLSPADRCPTQPSG